MTRPLTLLALILLTLLLSCTSTREIDSRDYQDRPTATEDTTDQTR